MRKIIVFVSALLLTVQAAQADPQAGSPGMGDPYFPDLGNGGYDVQHYDLALSVDMQNDAISGTVTITANATEDLSSFNLDFLPYAISSLTVNDAEAQFTQGEHELTITPSAPLANGQPFAAAVTYSGSPHGFTPESIPIEIGWNAYGAGDDGGIYVIDEPSGAPSWFPANDHPRDKATYTFRITVPNPYVVAANGLLQDTIDNGDTSTYVWEMDNPMASYLASVNIGRFTVQTEQGPDGIIIRNYFPASIADQVAPIFAHQSDMIQYFSTVFGPYPFPVYGAVVANTYLNFAMENQTMSLFGTSMLTPSFFGVPNDETVAHELSHQWYGDNISVKNWQDIWLNEGFATYAEVLWVEHTQGVAARDDYLRYMYGQITGTTSPPAKPPINDLFGYTLYVRGGWALQALRMRVGDDAFFNILRTYTQRFGGGNASTADFMALADEVSGQSLKDLFMPWLYADRTPDVPEMGLTNSGS